MDMKKTYETPKAEVERYQLDASIASNCETVVHNGPQMNGYSQCSDYIDPFETYSAARSVHNVQFYSEDTCDCYTTAGGGYWTSRTQRETEKVRYRGCTSCYALAA